GVGHEDGDLLGRAGRRLLLLLAGPRLLAALLLGRRRLALLGRVVDDVDRGAGARVAAGPQHEHADDDGDRDQQHAARGTGAPGRGCGRALGRLHARDASSAAVSGGGATGGGRHWQGWSGAGRDASTPRSVTEPGGGAVSSMTRPE